MNVEFTGERVIPGLVDVDLWNEHLARYAFAERFCRNRNVLDAGCGTGYGAAEISRQALRVTGVDQARDAIGFARTKYPTAAQWVQSSCTRIPFAGASFDTVLAYEVIEHLADWPELIKEARRVLSDSGVFLVSTPNKTVYAESREQSGPNPFHEHEFELEEFTSALRSSFAHVQLVLQNHGPCVSFEALGSREAEARIEGASEAPDANFYIAVCSSAPVDVPSFVYVPRAANVLHERQRHIRQLENELETKNSWLQRSQTEHAALVELHTSQTRELRASNEWAAELDRKLAAAADRIHQLQNELAVQQRAAVEMASGYQAQVEFLQDDLNSRTRWAQQTEARLMQQLQETATELARQVAELGRCVELLDKAEATVIERTNWAAGLQQDLDLAESRIAMARSSRWIKLGRMLNVGPEFDG